METKYITIPFDLERAKRIISDEEVGKIVTRVGRNVRIVCWDRKDIDCIVALIETEDGVEHLVGCNSKGNYVSSSESEYDLFLSIPEWTTFKDGDIYKTAQGGLAIYNTNYEPSINFICPYYVGLRNDGRLVFSNKKSGFGSKGETTLSITEEDRQKFIDALKASNHPLAKEYLKRFFPNHSNPSNIGKEYNFEPGQPVIGIDGRGEWRYDLFSHYKPEHKNGNYVCSGRSYSKCLPYNEHTKHLLGTTKDWEE